MLDNKLFRAGIGILLSFLIIWVGVQIKFVFHPIVVIFQTLTAPILIAGVLFFLLRPAVQFLARYKVPVPLAILLLYLLITCLITLIVLYVAPLIQTQLTQLISALPVFIENAVVFGYQLVQSEWFAQFMQSFNIDLDSIANDASTYAMKLLDIIGSNITSMVGFIANAVLIAVVIPFILYFLLKDGHKMFEGFIRFLPSKRREDGKKLLLEMDRTISLFIRGQITVAVSVGVMLLIGFKIIGLNYAILLALLAMVTNVIPYLGAFLSATPAVLVGLAHSPGMAIKVLIVTVIAQQIEGNLLSPVIMGKGLNIHPLTIILLLLVIGTLMGPIGLLLAIPGYAITKVVVVYVYRFIRLRSEEAD